MIEESGAWIVVAAIAAGGLLAAVALGALVVSRRRRRADAEAAEQALATTGEAEAMLAELARALERTNAEADRAQLTRARVERELRNLRSLTEIGRTLELAQVLDAAVEAAANVADAPGAMIVAETGPDAPQRASFGLSAEEAERGLLGPIRGGETRAVFLSFRYASEEAAADDLRLSGGVALPLPNARGDAVGTVGVFWRRVQRELSDEELDALDRLAGIVGAAVANAARFAEVSRHTDIDEATRLHNERYFNEALAREWARGRRHARRLSVLRMSAQGAPSLDGATLGALGDRVRAATRSSDVACHLGDGEFAVLLPEAEAIAGELVFRRVTGALENGAPGGVQLVAGVSELGPEDDADGLVRRAERAVADARSSTNGVPS